MKVSRCRLMSIFLLLMLHSATPEGSIAQQISASLEWQPQLRLVAPRIAPAVSEDSGRALTPELRDDQWVFTLPDETGIYRVFVIALSGTLPPEYLFRELNLELSYDSQRDIDAVLAPTRVRGSASEVRALFGRNVQAISGKSLQTVYQESRAAAFSRMEILQRRWVSLNDYDVQAVYKFLEVSVVLGKRTDFMAVQRDLDVATEWLVDAIANQQARVTSAMGGKLKLAQDVLAEVAAIKGRRLGKVWKSILDELDVSRRCALLAQYDSHLRQMSADVYSNTVRVSGVPSAHVSSALAQCVVRIIIASLPLPASVPTPEILVRRMELLAGPASAAIRTQLQSDIAVLSELAVEY